MQWILHPRIPVWVDRNLRIVLVARWTMSIARAIASVVTAIYLAAIGFSAVEIGVLFVGVTIMSAILAALIGLVADRWGRKPFLIVIPLAAAGASLVFAFSQSAGILFAAAAMGSFGRGSGAGAGNVGPYQPAESAFIADAVSGNNRASAFGLVAFMSSLGALAGGLLVAVIHNARGMSNGEAMLAFRPDFIAAAVFAATSGLLALLLREPVTKKASPSGKRDRVRWPVRSWSVLWRFWVTNATNGAAIGLFGPFVSYWLYRRYGASPGAVGLLFAVVNLGSLASTLVAARIGRLMGTVRTIAVVRACTAVLLVPMVLAPTFWIASVLYFFRMLVQRIGLPLRQSFTQDMADPSERASVAALSNLPAQVTMAGSQVVAGYLFDEVSLASPFLLAAVFQMGNAILYAFLFAYRPPAPRPPAGPVAALLSDQEFPDLR